MQPTVDGFLAQYCGSVRPAEQDRHEAVRALQQIVALPTPRTPASTAKKFIEQVSGRLRHERRFLQIPRRILPPLSVAPTFRPVRRELPSTRFIAVFAVACINLNVAATIAIPTAA
jgi:hypothetical protein